MINKDFPCKTCGHSAEKHYANISDGETVCTGCAPNDRSTWATINEHFHPFIGDNLRYMELLNRKEQLRNEQA